MGEPLAFRAKKPLYHDFENPLTAGEGIFLSKKFLTMGDPLCILEIE